MSDSHDFDPMFYDPTAKHDGDTVKPAGRLADVGTAEPAEDVAGADDERLPETAETRPRNPSHKPPSG